VKEYDLGKPYVSFGLLMAGLSLVGLVVSLSILSPGPIASMSFFLILSLILISLRLHIKLDSSGLTIKSSCLGFHNLVHVPAKEIERIFLRPWSHGGSNYYRLWVRTRAGKDIQLTVFDETGVDVQAEAVAVGALLQAKVDDPPREVTLWKQSRRRRRTQGFLMMAVSPAPIALGVYILLASKFDGIPLAAWFRSWGRQKSGTLTSNGVGIVFVVLGVGMLFMGLANFFSLKEKGDG
jgi:hypothetical protein